MLVARRIFAGMTATTDRIAVDPADILALADAWERCAAHFIELAEREDDPIARANSQEAAAANRRHAAQLRELVEAASLALP